ncbi:homeobox expressed in ES cells 1-like [Arapaima gigas]
MRVTLKQAAGKAMQDQFSVEWLSQSSRGRSHCQPGSLMLEERSACSRPPRSPPGSLASRIVYLNQSDEQSGSEQQQEGSSTRDPSRHQSNIIVIESSSSSCLDDETSECESEGECSLSSTQGAPQNFPFSGRKPRTAFTEEQVHQLERAFKKSHYLDIQEKAELCKRLCLSEKQVRNWFQNRRMKLKRNLQDTECQAMASCHQWHWLHFQAFRPGSYSGYIPTLALDGHILYQVPLSLCHGPSPAVDVTPHPLFLDTFYQHCSNLPNMAMPSSSIPAVPSYYPFALAERHCDGNSTDTQVASVWKK